MKHNFFHKMLNYNSKLMISNTLDKMTIILKVAVNSVHLSKDKLITNIKK